MRELCREHSLSAVCAALGVSRSGRYARLSRGRSARAQRDERLGAMILAIHRDNRQVYGYPRVCLALKLQGVAHSRRRVARLMGELGIEGRRRGRFKPQLTDSRHGLGYDPNVLGALAAPRAPHQVWVSDTTYIRCESGWAYLAATMDLHSRYIVGWSVSAANDSDLTAGAMEKARRAHPNAAPLHHSDRGSTYASEGFRRSLRGLERSMSRKGNCYDNAAMESFFGTLKAECSQGVAYRDVEEARRELFSYIEGFYNSRRLHTSIGMSPRSKLLQSRSRAKVAHKGGCGDLTPAESSPPL